MTQEDLELFEKAISSTGSQSEAAKERTGPTPPTCEQEAGQGCFFPVGIFNPWSAQSDEFERTYYSARLSAMKEPNFLGKTHSPSYRCIIDRYSSDIRVARIWRCGDNACMARALWDKTQGEMTAHDSWLMTEEQWQEFATLLGRTRTSDAPGRKPLKSGAPHMHAPAFVFEVAENGAYRVKVAHYPRDVEEVPSVFELCDFMMKVPVPRNIRDPAQFEY